MSNPVECTLYGETLWISPYVFSAFVALREKGIDFATAEVSLVEMAHTRPGYAEPTLTARVPALEHHGFWLAESSAIAEYLEDVFPAPRHARLFPADARDRARARMLMAWFRSDLGALREERPTTTMFYERATEPLSRAGSDAAAKLIRVAEKLVVAADKPLFGAWCLADSELAFMLHRLILNRDPLPASLRSYAEREWRRPSACAFLDHARPTALPIEYWLIPSHEPTSPFVRAAREKLRGTPSGPPV